MQLSPLVWKTKQLFLITEKIQKLLPRGNSAHHAFSVLTKESGLLSRQDGLYNSCQWISDHACAPRLELGELAATESDRTALQHS